MPSPAPMSMRMSSWECSDCGKACPWGELTQRRENLHYPGAYQPLVCESQWSAEIPTPPSPSCMGVPILELTRTYAPSGPPPTGRVGLVVEVRGDTEGTGDEHATWGC